MYRVFQYETDKLAGDAGDTQKTRNPTVMQDRKWRVASYRAKKQRKNRNSNILMGRTTFYLKVELQKAFEITSRSR